MRACTVRQRTPTLRSIAPNRQLRAAALPRRCTSAACTASNRGGARWGVRCTLSCGDRLNTAENDATTLRSSSSCGKGDDSRHVRGRQDSTAAPSSVEDAASSSTRLRCSSSAKPARCTNNENARSVGVRFRVCVTRGFFVTERDVGFATSTSTDMVRAATDEGTSPVTSSSLLSSACKAAGAFSHSSSSTEASTRASRGVGTSSNVGTSSLRGCAGAPHGRASLCRKPFFRREDSKSSRPATEASSSDSSLRERFEDIGNNRTQQRQVI